MPSMPPPVLFLMLAKEMIRKGNLLLSKAEPVRLEEAARLEQLKAQSDELSQQGSSQRATLAESKLVWSRQWISMRLS